jgi:hypothetical protein
LIRVYSFQSDSYACYFYFPALLLALGSSHLAGGISPDLIILSRREAQMWGLAGGLLVCAYKHSDNKYQSAADVELISDLVRSYMRNPRSVVLAVVSAKNDYANQIILKRVTDAWAGIKAGHPPSRFAKRSWLYQPC